MYELAGVALGGIMAPVGATVAALTLLVAQKSMHLQASGGIR